jgi:hypothetical protein
MLQRDGSIVHAIHAERAVGVYGQGPERRALAGRGGASGGLRQTIGHAIVRLGTWLAADSTRPAPVRPRVPSSA